MMICKIFKIELLDLNSDVTSSKYYLIKYGEDKEVLNPYTLMDTYSEKPHWFDNCQVGESLELNNAIASCVAIHTSNFNDMITDNLKWKYKYQELKIENKILKGEVLME